jgi:hypothetical protein
MEKMKLPFIDSDLLYTGALYDRFDCMYQYIKNIIYNNKQNNGLIFEKKTGIFY